MGGIRNVQCSCLGSNQKLMGPKVENSGFYGQKEGVRLIKVSVLHSRTTISAKMWHFVAPLYCETLHIS